MTTAIILSGGKGLRLKDSDIPKQYIKVAGRPVIGYVLHAVLSSTKVDEIIVVAAKEWRVYITQAFEAEAKALSRTDIDLSFALFVEVDD